MLAVTTSTRLIDLRRPGLGGVGDRQVREPGRHGGDVQAARAVAPLAADRPILGLGAGARPRRAGAGGVADQALDPLVVRRESFAEKLVDAMRMHRMTFRPIPPRPLGAPMIREPQGADLPLFIATDERGVAIARAQCVVDHRPQDLVGNLRLDLDLAVDPMNPLTDLGIVRVDQRAIREGQVGEIAASPEGPRMAAGQDRVVGLGVAAGASGFTDVTGRLGLQGMFGAIGSRPG